MDLYDYDFEEVDDALICLIQQCIFVTPHLSCLFCGYHYHYSLEDQTPWVFMLIQRDHIWNTHHQLVMPRCLYLLQNCDNTAMAA